MSTSPSGSTSGPTPWQDKLEELCREAQILPPVFHIVSDRRVLGGRTAWSSRVTVQGKVLSARFWYDGRNLNNAKEDAAECAVNWLTSNTGPTTSTTASSTWTGW
ncbi:hypothetical protein CCM_04613 [Cordyceps militaris CM01]|uniref:DRBM domain-containing protein n=1 Tax=Cordyceps militaris (strain CM01) TaxID=983644 RepID=G3JGB1_CORMM|nr:uncharacterized protein CCM_04613 [Cordyceps militaris CM01]EGX93241.1 hypothetical protein CCM_04613 [Cordyceps militaris CM01]